MKVSYNLKRAFVSYCLYGKIILLVFGLEKDWVMGAFISLTLLHSKLKDPNHLF